MSRSQDSKHPISQQYLTPQAWKPADCSRMTPYLMVRDARASLDFYRDAFGFEGQIMMSDNESRVVHAEIRKQGELIAMFASEGSFGSPQKAPASNGVPSPIGLYVYCEDVDRLTEKAIAAGAEAMGEVATQFWGDRTSCLRDPDGYGWTFATRVSDFDPARIPDGFSAEGDSGSD